MNTKMKHLSNTLISLLLVLTLCMSFAATAYAAEVEDGGNSSGYDENSADVMSASVDETHKVLNCSVCKKRTGFTARDLSEYTGTSESDVYYLCDICGNSYIPSCRDTRGHRWGCAKVLLSPTCTENGMKHYSCSRCGVGIITVIPAAGHVPGADASCSDAQLCVTCGAVLSDALGHDYRPDVTTPTCTEGGYTTYTCSRCGDSYTDDYTDALDHTWDAGQIISGSTCETSGLMEYRCEMCGATRTEVMTAEGHTPGVEATCTEDQICTICGTVLVGAFGHDYQPDVTAPTCTEGGYTTYACTNCGDSYVEDYTDALDHVWDAGQIISGSTCDTAGLMEYRCEMCGATRTEAMTAEGHTPGASATCTEDQVCTICGAVLVGTFGHDYQPDVTAPSCTEGGYTTYTCSRCGDSYVDDYTDALDHTWDAGQIISGSTCDAAGLMEYRCEMCGATRTEAMTAEGHTPGIEATCTEDQICTVCGTVLVGAFGHGYQPDVTAPSCTEGGYTTYTCSHCGDSYVDDYTDALDHVWDDGRSVTVPTCNGEGVTEYRCEKCGGVRIEVNAVAGHVPGEDATCTEKQTCTACGVVLAEALGHDYQPDVTVPTCTKGGYTTFTCSRCGDSYVDEYTDALDHGWDDGKAVSNPTCNGEGVTEYRCTRCGDFRLEAVSANGHTPGDEATCTEPQLCTLCGAVLAKATGHSYQSKVTAPTETEMGYTTYTCEKCGDSYKADYTKPTGKPDDEEQSIPDETVTGSDGTIVVTGIVNGDKPVSLTVKVEDYETTRPVPNAVVEVKDKTVRITLPDGMDMDEANRILVTVTDNSKKPQSGVPVVVKNDLGNQAQGKTDKAGQMVAPVILVTAEHTAYVVGYGDGNFGPSRSMSRAEAATIFARLLAAKNGDVIYDNVHCSFSDVSGKAWYAGYVKYLETFGVIKGDADGKFRPTDKITRAEFVAMSVLFYKAYGFEPVVDTKALVFSDVSADYWAAGYINEASANGWIVGYGDGKFAPDDEITRAEVVTIVNRVFGRFADQSYVETNTRNLRTFKDVPKNHWAYYAILEAANSHTAVFVDDAENWRVN